MSGKGELAFTASLPLVLTCAEKQNLIFGSSCLRRPSSPNTSTQWRPSRPHTRQQRRRAAASAAAEGCAGADTEAAMMGAPEEEEAASNMAKTTRSDFWPYTWERSCSFPLVTLDECLLVLSVFLSSSWLLSCSFPS